MKRKLALQLLQSIVPGKGDEGTTAELFRELQFLADYKYNKYEMYHPGRQFLENLYLWLLQFNEDEREAALEFVRKELLFVSRAEFEQLAQLLYHDKIRRQQIMAAAKRAGLPSHRVRAIRESAAFGRVARASLYVGMSDGARLDYIRRHNLEINNEQVVPYYRVATEKITELLADLRAAVGDQEAKFSCLFLVDDFCGSGKTLLREVVQSNVESPWIRPEIPSVWRSRLRAVEDTNLLELSFHGELSKPEQTELLSMSSCPNYAKAIEVLIKKCGARDTLLKGSFQRVAKDLHEILEPDASVCFCPLLITEQALTRIQSLIPRLPGVFANGRVLPAAVIESTVQITSDAHPIGKLCEQYYSEELEDQHTGSVKYGLENCGLPLVLHHNTPNNSLFLLWARKKKDFSPLFVRYERHGREGT